MAVNVFEGWRRIATVRKRIVALSRYDFTALDNMVLSNNTAGMLEALRWIEREAEVIATNCDELHTFIKENADG